MSYLSPTRLHFAGRFQANVPTANNDVDRITPNPTRPPNPSWNPRGDGTWRLLGCHVTAAFLKGKAVTADDPVLKYLVQDSERRAPAKIADLDPMQQMATTIYGLDLRLCTGEGGTVLGGECAPTSLSDLFMAKLPSSGCRTPSDKTDGRGSGIFQTVITLFEPTRDLPSEFLTELCAASLTGRLSVKFTVDGFVTTHADPEFTTGRIVGVIGPMKQDEPDHFVLGRHLLGTMGGDVNHAVAVVDKPTRKILLDFANSPQCAELGGGFLDKGNFSLRCRQHKDTVDRFNFGAIPYREKGWYEASAGIVELPPGTDLLSDAELEALRTQPIELWQDKGAESAPVLNEASDGYYARADDVVFRVSPGERQPVTFYVSRYGNPAPAVLELDVDAVMVPDKPTLLGSRPPEALVLPRIIADQRGKGIAMLEAGDPGRIRGFSFDGQVYSVRHTIVGAQTDLVAEWDVFHVRIWDRLDLRCPFWSRTVRPILAYYQRLFPIKKRFIDLTNRRDVAEHRRLLEHVLRLPIEDPNHMPVTRDLSPARRDAILLWLQSLPLTPPRPPGIDPPTADIPDDDMPPPPPDAPWGPGKMDAVDAIRRQRLENLSSQ